MKSIKLFFIFSIMLFIFLVLNCSAAMKSANYKINADSIDAGGNLSQSENYKTEDTFGEVVSGEGSSVSYKMKAGFQYMINSYLILTVDSNSKDLGSLLPGSPITGQSVISVTTDSWGGYSLSAVKNHAMLHTDNTTYISDHNGTITAPVFWESPDDTGFGFSLINGTGIDSKWGNSLNYKYAAFPDVSTAIHTKTGFKSSVDDTTIGYKVDAPNDQKSGAYSCVITFLAVAAL